MVRLFPRTDLIAGSNIPQLFVSRCGLWAVQHDFRSVQLGLRSPQHGLWLSQDEVRHAQDEARSAQHGFKVAQDEVAVPEDGFSFLLVIIPHILKGNGDGRIFRGWMSREGFENWERIIHIAKTRRSMEYRF